MNDILIPFMVRLHEPACLEFQLYFQGSNATKPNCFDYQPRKPSAKKYIYFQGETVRTRPWQDAGPSLYP